MLWKPSTRPYIKPHIIHVVAYCEALHRATYKEILESVKIARESYNNAQQGLPEFSTDPQISQRKDQLLAEAKLIIRAIEGLGDGLEEPLLEPQVLYSAIKLGILDAPNLAGFSVARGKLKTQLVNGDYRAVDEKEIVLGEQQRLEQTLAFS